MVPAEGKDDPEKQDATAGRRGATEDGIPSVEIDGPPIQVSPTTAEVGVAQLLRDAQRALSRLLASRIADYGVSIGQWYFLRALWEEDGLTQRELSFRVGMMEPTTVTALNGMEQRGLVARVRNPRDRRKMNIFLTDRGRALQAELMPIEAEINKVATEGVPPRDAEALDRALRQILKNLTTATT